MQDVLSIDDNTSRGSDLEMPLCGRNEAHMVVGVVESSNSPSFDLGKDIEERVEHVENNLVAFQALRGGLANKECLLTPSPRNNSNEGMQPKFGVVEEG